MENTQDINAEAVHSSAWLGRIWRGIREYAWAFYLGAALAALGYPWHTWQNWAVALPVVVLNAMRPNDGDQARRKPL